MKKQAMTQAMIQKSVRFLAAMAMVALCGCASIAERTVTISEAQMQQKLQARLIAPIRLLHVFDVHLSNPVIKVDGQTERMSAHLDATVSSPITRLLKGGASISGKLRFDPVSRAVLLTEPRLEAFNIDGLGGRANELLSVLGAQLTGELLKDFPLYTLKPDDLTFAGIHFTPKIMRITPQGLQVTVSPLQ